MVKKSASARRFLNVNSKPMLWTLALLSIGGVVAVLMQVYQPAYYGADDAVEQVLGDAALTRQLNRQREKLVTTMQSTDSESATAPVAPKKEVASVNTAKGSDTKESVDTSPKPLPYIVAPTYNEVNEIARMMAGAVNKEREAKFVQLKQDLRNVRLRKEISFEHLAEAKNKEQTLQTEARIEALENGSITNIGRGMSDDTGADVSTLPDIELVSVTGAFGAKKPEADLKINGVAFNNWRAGSKFSGVQLIEIDALNGCVRYSFNNQVQPVCM